MQLCVLSARLWNTLYNCCAIYWDSNLMMREMIFDVRKVFTFYWCITQIVLSSGTGNKCWPRATGFSSPYVKSVLENKNHFRDMNEIYPILSHWRNIQEDRRRKQTLQEHFLSSIVPPVGFFHDILFAPGIVEQNSRQSSLVWIGSNTSFYRTQVYLGSDLWVLESKTNERFCSLNWCVSGWWRNQLNTNW